jgi:cytochrome c oxidase subunit 2
MLAAVLPELGLGLPRDVASEGGRIDALLHQTAGLTAIAAVLLTGVLLVAVLRRRGSSASPSRALTLGGALAMFGIIDGNLIVHGLHDIDRVFWSFAEVDARPDVVRVEVNAHQWAWDIRTAGADGKFGTADDVVALNELVVPVGRPVLVQLAAVDVIHSFYVPNLRLKTDAVPGQINSLWFQVTEPGEYEIACAQHCGQGHYKMRGVLRALPAAEYEAFASQATAAAAHGFDPDDATAHWAWPWRTP